uniref:Uncharacterized protein n=1 Tax=Lactuca sativa TaxID=4236 RepID=A0A9R1WTT3_LACSA|nr:hypothetical protein LSAT_V11C100025900 [Lactuca sativa]
MSAVLIEAITLTLLVALLIFFTCKCVFILLHKKIKNQPQPQSQNLQHMSSTKDSSENITGQPSGLSKRESYPYQKQPKLVELMIKAFKLRFCELARTCYNFYQSTPIKLARENYFLHSGQLMFKSLFVIYTQWTTTNFLI